MWRAPSVDVNLQARASGGGPAAARQTVRYEMTAAGELGKAFEWRLGEVSQVDPRLCIPLRQRHAKRYVESGLALIGALARRRAALADAERGPVKGEEPPPPWRQ